MGYLTPMRGFKWKQSIGEIRLDGCLEDFVGWNKKQSQKTMYVILVSFFVRKQVGNI